MSAEFDSKMQNYASNGTVRHPIYSVNFGVLYVSILATTGECVGGGLTTSAGASEASAEDVQGPDTTSGTTEQSANGQVEGTDPGEDSSSQSPTEAESSANLLYMVGGGLLLAIAIWGGFLLGRKQ